MNKFLRLLTVLLLLATGNLNAQDLHLPPVSSLKTQEDLERTSSDLVSAANWLEQHPLSTLDRKRKDVERFVFMWISASKKVNVEMNEKILSLDDKNPGLVMVYTGAAARYLVQKKSEDTKAAQLAALKTVVSVYEHSEGIIKDKQLDALAKADKKNRLREWLKN